MLSLESEKALREDMICGFCIYSLVLDEGLSILLANQTEHRQKNSKYLYDFQTPDIVSFGHEEFLYMGIPYMLKRV